VAESPNISLQASESTIPPTYYLASHTATNLLAVQNWNTLVSSNPINAALEQPAASGDPMFVSLRNWDLRLRVAELSNGQGGSPAAGKGVNFATLPDLDNDGLPDWYELNEIIASGGALTLEEITPTIPGVTRWFKADALTLANNSKVVSWTDSSGSSSPATQSDPNKQPIYVADAGNGRPAVRFDAVDDEMITNCSIAGDSWTVFVVYSYRGTTPAHSRAVDGSNNWFMGPYLGFYEVCNGTSTPVSVVSNVFVMETYQQQPGGGIHWTNGGWRGGIAFDGSPGTIKLSNSLEPLNGDIAEVIVFDTAVDGEVRDYIHNYLGLKYGIMLDSGS
jgi:hypothetical protein